MTTVANPQYRCGNERRREVVRAAGKLNGIDWLEVGADPVTLQVHLLQAAPAGMDADSVVIAGGTRIRGIKVIEATATAEVLTVIVDRPGDFSPYELRLVDPTAGGATPAGFDPRLDAVVFSFKAGCDTHLDCATEKVCPPVLLPEPQLDYLAKDYESFRGLMLDRLATTLPGWTERNPADLMVALVELLAYAADRLSYFQDAVATEAYLGTARRRVSVRRHARLLDYHMHEGCSARAFLKFQVSTGVDLKAGIAVRAASAEPAVIFETMHPVGLRVAHDKINFHTWSDEDCCLPKGATRATLRGSNDITLAAGDLLLMEDLDNPAHRQVVRLTSVNIGVDPVELLPTGEPTPIIEIEWARADALAFPLCLRNAQACGNVALADHGETHQRVSLLPEDPSPPGPWRPLAPESPLTFAAPAKLSGPASELLEPDPRAANPAIRLRDVDEEWTAVPDLLGSGPTAQVFVVEVEGDRTARLRFGDDQSGRRPVRGREFFADARVGCGPTGNLPAEALNQMVIPASGVTGVCNPLPAVGGTDPEPIERVRQVAPQAFRVQERAVTEADYARLADRFHDVQRAAGSLRWTGSWYTAFVTIDKEGGGSPEDDDDLGERLVDFLDTYRMAGVDVEINAPVPVPIDLALDVCGTPDALGPEVEARVFDALSSRVLPDGRRGFFHPDNFTFGQAVYLSQIQAAVLAVPGVAWLRPTLFRRFGRPDAGELQAGVLRVQGLEIAQLEGDPSFPERGRVTLTMAGGL
jgi:hypothetical protein